MSLHREFSRRGLFELATIIYWSSTGNTEQMANAVAEGVKSAGANAKLLTPGEVTAQTVQDAAALAFGCPAMGNEVLEEGEFDPMFSSVEGSLSGKKVGLFGSYGWGDGEWMRDWCGRCRSAGAFLVAEEGIMAHEAPDDEVLDACRALGKSLVGA